MHRIKNLTNSPHKIILAGNKMGRLAARGEDVFDVAPQLLPHYKTLGYLQLTEVKEQEPPPVVVLNGSSLLASTIDLGEGRELLLGELVAYAQGASGLTVEEWNLLPDPEREHILAATVTGLKSAPEVETATVAEIVDAQQASPAGAGVQAPASEQQVAPPVVVEKPELVARAKALGIAGVGLNWGVPKLQAAIAEAEKAKADSGQAGGEG